MEEFDPRRQPARYAPKLLMATAALAAALVGWRVAAREPDPPKLRLTPAAPDAVQMVREEPRAARAG